MHIKTLINLVAVIAIPMQAMAQLDISDGQWTITFDSSLRTLTYTQSGIDLIRGAYIAVNDPSEVQLFSKNYPNVTLSSQPVFDPIGTGTKYTYTYSGLHGVDNIEQSIYIYPTKNYLLVDATLVATGHETTTRFIAPIQSELSSTTFLPGNGENYIYQMPHDNDNWVSYSAQRWDTQVSVTSCEVSAAYDVMSRNGLVIGSIEHDNWKSGITIMPNGTNCLHRITVAAGMVSTMTNDVNEEFPDRPSLTLHGAITGKRVSSPRFFMGLYTDWRDGLEELGEATATLSPRLPWTGGTIFAWQSWGGMAEKVNYEGAVNVVDFFKNDLMTRNFHNENGTCYMVLDSYWSNLNEQQLRQFVARCRANGQIPGIYFTPFSYWGTEEQACTQFPYEGSPYTYADMAITANGRMRRIVSIALDPTHPGTLEYNRRQFAKFKDYGFEYIKLDFINNGTLEADSYYAEDVTTGIQAYNYGMDRLIKMLDGMFIDLSIAPVFPAKGHARRISCDCWGELDNSMYCLNSLEMAWWLDRVYQYNDPDHLVLSRAQTDGEARIRYTCGVMTGTILLGDNYSQAGTCLGSQAERDLALRIATNKEVNAVARIGHSFRPVEGRLEHQTSRYGRALFGVDQEFVLETDDALYYVVFNYDRDYDFSKTVNFSRLGIDVNLVKSVRELWEGQSVNIEDSSFTVTVPKCDVRLFRIRKRQLE